MESNTFSFKTLSGWPAILLNYKMTLMKPQYCLLGYWYPTDVCKSYETQSVSS